MKDDKMLSRRLFLQRISFAGVAGIGAGMLAAGCGGGEEAPAEEIPPAGETAPPTAAQQEYGMTECGDLSALTPEEMQQRVALNYVDRTPIPEKQCQNCQLYIVPEGGGPCGGCQILKGPVHQEGYCTAWVAKIA